MEGNKQSSSASSFTSDLFGSKGSSSSSEILASNTSPSSSKVSGRESVRSDGEAAQKPKKEPATVYWQSRLGISDDTGLLSEGGSKILPNKDINGCYQEEKVHPCHYSSSIFYGGQDVYFRSKNTTQGSAYASVNKDSGDDDSDGASRGNWWQGSLYY